MHEHGPAHPVIKQTKQLRFLYNKCILYFLFFNSSFLHFHKWIFSYREQRGRFFISSTELWLLPSIPFDSPFEVQLPVLFWRINVDPIFQFFFMVLTCGTCGLPLINCFSFEELYIRTWSWWHTCTFRILFLNFCTSSFGDIFKSK